MTLPERIEKIVRAWPQWSPGERTKMDAIVEEVLEHCREGNGNPFIVRFCKVWLTPQLKLTQEAHR